MSDYMFIIKFLFALVPLTQWRFGLKHLISSLLDLSTT